MTSPPRRVRWHRPQPDVQRVGVILDRLTTLRPGAPSAEAVAPFDREVQTLLRVGVPIAEEATTAKELAVELLKLVAEVEHALMAQYLYTSISVADAEGGSQNHQQEVLNVAIQEMGHLATVQNILLLLGGPPALHLQRDLYRNASEKNPLPFVLEPISRESLAKDVAAEMPAEIPEALRKEVDGLVEIAQQSAGVELHRVGAIYTMLRWLFLPAAEARAWVDLASVVPLPPEPHVVDADLIPAAEVTRFEARGDEWPATVANFLLDTPHTCAEVVTAIDRIAAQGEGLTQSERSHFFTFLGLVKAFDNGEFNSRPLAMSPTLGGGNGAIGGEAIAHVYTRAWGMVFSLHYTLLVLTILHAFRTARTEDGSPGLRERLVDLALRAMRRIIVPVSQICASLPMRDHGAALAGPPYDLDPAILAVDEQNDDLPQRHLKLLDDLAAQYTVIERAAEFESRPGDAIALNNLRTHDKRRRDLFSPPPGT